MKNKIVSLGEIMLRLSPVEKKRFYQANIFEAVYGGGEANVAVSLAMFGHNACFVSKVPENEIGESCVNFLKTYGVNTKYIKTGNGRLGIYFLEHGASIRPSKVVYDRANSAMSNANVNDFDFNEIFNGATWFHISGITPAISKTASELSKKALKIAKEKGIKTSFDLNFRKKLWTSDEAIKTLKPLMKYVDICIGNEEDAKNCLGFSPKNTHVESGILNIQGYEETLKNLKEEFNFQIVVSTLRESISASKNNWSACLYDGEEFIVSKKYSLDIVDRVGAGDSFSAGLIHGLITKNTHQEALEFATASSALKHSIPGDFNLIKENEVENLVSGDSSGRVVR